MSDPTKSIPDQIRDASRPTFANVLIKEWDGLVVRLKSWSAGERIDFDAETALLEEHVSEADANRIGWARAVARSVVDEHGQPAYQLPTIEELMAAVAGGNGALAEALKVYVGLAEANAKGLRRLFKVVCDLNAMSEDDEAQIEKN